MKKMACLILLSVLVPYASNAVACKKQSKIHHKNHNTTVCCPSFDSGAKGLADELNKMSKELPDFRNTVLDLKNSVRELSKKIPDPHDKKPDEELFSKDGWLTFLTILIALSAYMATLRWTLIQKCKQEDKKRESYDRRMASINAELQTIQAKKSKLKEDEALKGGQRKDKLTNREAGLENQKGDLEKNKSASVRDSNKYQLSIIWISFVDVLLALAAIPVIAHIFCSYVLSPKFDAPHIGTYLFLIAIAAFLLLHYREWRKTMSVNRDRNWFFKLLYCPLCFTSKKR